MYKTVKYILMYVLFVQNVDEIIYHIHVFHGIVLRYNITTYILIFVIYKVNVVQNCFLYDRKYIYSEVDASKNIFLK